MALSNFRVEDITFKGARRQSEILKELGMDEKPKGKIDIPVSLTPEQVKKFYMTQLENAKSMPEKRIYNLTLMWIDELLELRKEKIAFENLRGNILDIDGSENVEDIDLSGLLGNTE